MGTNQLLAAMDEVLAQGEALLAGLSDAQYRESAETGASIGAHYRHSLEHFKILLEAAGGGTVDYDRRARDPQLETERLTALRVTHEFRQAARFLATLPPDRPIEARYKISYAGTGACSAVSTLGREIMYAVSHAIHHYALIALTCGQRRVAVPAHFGVAPSTLAHRAPDEAARRTA